MINLRTLHLDHIEDLMVNGFVPPHVDFTKI